MTLNTAFVGPRAGTGSNLSLQVDLASTQAALGSWGEELQATLADVLLLVYFLAVSNHVQHRL